MTNAVKKKKKKNKHDKQIKTNNWKRNGRFRVQDSCDRIQHEDSA